jgi:hypothetical protein
MKIFIFPKFRSKIFIFPQFRSKNVIFPQFCRIFRKNLKKAMSASIAMLDITFWKFMEFYGFKKPFLKTFF